MFAIAINIPKATQADVYYRCTLQHSRFTPEIDATIKQLASQHHLAEVSRLIGMDGASLKARAKKLGVTFLTLPEATQPSDGEWIHYATIEAYLAAIPPKVVLAGSRKKDACKARWRAYARLLDSDPQFSVAGVARVSGHHWTTVLHGLERVGWKRK